MRKVDRDALERALVMAREESPSRAEQIAHKLEHEPRQQVGQFAAYCCQCNTLRLKPWQPPPCSIDPSDIRNIIAAGYDGVRGSYAGAKLLQKMLQNGLSEYEPDPIRALEAARKPAV